MPWTVVNIGKFKNKGNTLPQIMLTDPDWFFWAMERNIFNSGALKAEAEDLRRKARRIRIPKSGPLDLEVEYLIPPRTDTLGGVEVVPARQPAHVGGGRSLRSEHFDLSMARKIASYDKSGGKIIIRAIKYHVFGKTDFRLTRKRCEEFFDDDSNFE